MAGAPGIVLRRLPRLAQRGTIASREYGDLLKIDLPDFNIHRRSKP